MRVSQTNMSKVIVNSKIFKAQDAISQSRVLNLLVDYSPQVVSTIFVEFDTDQSDIDIVCEYQQQTTFAKHFSDSFCHYDSYNLAEFPDYAIGHFKKFGFLFEVYATHIPVTQQLAFRHYHVMKRIALFGDESLKQQIRALKNDGLKTEAAISTLLRLEGDPYTAVLELESWSDDQLKFYLHNNI
jgi:Domain of unknown function (DUF4269)